MAALPRHVLITGGSRGIGLSIAQLFAKKGYRCTLIARSEEALKAAVATLHPLPEYQNPDPGAVSEDDSLSEDPTLSFMSEDSSPSPPSTIFKATEDAKLPPHDNPTPLLPRSKQLNPHTHSYIAGDITTQSAFWDSALPKPPFTREPHHPSRIDVLVNCAGTSQSSLFYRTNEVELNRILNTNLTALIAGTRFLMRYGYLRVSASGISLVHPQSTTTTTTSSIINISSLLGLHGGFGAVTYAASKAGVLGFTRGLAAEAAHRVRVNAIVPGYINTDMTKDLPSEKVEKRIPLGRFGKPEEIAQAALFLAENEYANNCVVNLDGGLSAV